MAINFLKALAPHTVPVIIATVTKTAVTAKKKVLFFFHFILSFLILFNSITKDYNIIFINI